MIPVSEAIHTTLVEELYSRCDDKFIARKLAKSFISCNVEAVQQCLDLGLKPDILLPGGYVPITYVIHFATSGGWDQVVQLLLERGADPNVTDSSGTPLLHLLLPSGSIDLVSLALNKGADVETKGPTGDTALLEAVHYRQVDSVKLLLEQGANPNYTAGDGNSALIWAAGRSNGVGVQNCHACVKVLLQYGAFVNFQNRRGYTPLMVASVIRESEHVQTLLTAGADPNLEDNRCEAALLKAVSTNSENVVKVLLQNNVNVNTTNSNGTSPSMSAVSPEVMLMLLSCGADPNLCDKDGNTALHYHSRANRVTLVTLLLDFKVNVELLNHQGETPLQIAVRSRSQNVVDLLLNVDTSPNNINSSSISILHDAIFPYDYFHTINVFSFLTTNTLITEFTLFANEASSFSKNLVDQLVQRGADVNCIGEGGVTPLMLAAAIGNEHILRILLKSGAQTDLVDNEGRTALAYACKWGCAKAVEQLLVYGCHSNSQDYRGNLPVFYAAYYLHMDVMLLLMVELAFFCNISNHTSL